MRRSVSARQTVNKVYIYIYIFICTSQNTNKSSLYEGKVKQFRTKMGIEG